MPGWMLEVRLRRHARPTSNATLMGKSTTSAWLTANDIAVRAIVQALKRSNSVKPTHGG